MWPKSNRTYDFSASNTQQTTIDSELYLQTSKYNLSTSTYLKSS